MQSARRRSFIKSLSAAAAAASLPFGAAPALGQRRPMPDLVILLPGITGSVLQKDGRDLWAFSVAGITGVLTTLGRNINALKLADDPPDVDDLGDGITAPRLFPDTHLIPGLWKIDGYGIVRQW